MLSRLVWGVVVCFSMTCVSFGEDFPKPGPEHEKIKALEGTWDAVMNMGGQKSKATAVYKSICGGMWMQSDFTGDLGGIKFQGHGLDGYDVNKKKYVGVWFDSMSSAPMHFEGNYEPKSKLLVMTGESTNAENKLEKFKNVTETKDNDHFTFKMFMIQPDGKENLAFSIDYTRRK